MKGSHVSADEQQNVEPFRVEMFSIWQVVTQRNACLLEVSSRQKFAIPRT